MTLLKRAWRALRNAFRHDALVDDDKLARDTAWTEHYLNPLGVGDWSTRNEPPINLREAFEKVRADLEEEEGDKSVEIYRDEPADALREALTDRDREWASIEGTPGVADTTDLDVTDLSELRRVYGGTVPDRKLIEWAIEAKRFASRQDEIRRRLAEIATDLPAPPDDGYRPAAGEDAGTSPTTGVVYPPAVKEPTTKEWVDLRLEQAYGLQASGRPNLPRPVREQQAGFSMRYLNDLRRRAERRDASLSPYELAIIRSRGLA